MSAGLGRQRGNVGAGRGLSVLLDLGHRKNQQLGAHGGASSTASDVIRTPTGLELRVATSDLPALLRWVPSLQRLIDALEADRR